jgi:hypothetical protein
VESFFDVCYEISFVGAPGSVLEGLGGTTSDCDGFYLGFPTSVTDARLIPGVAAGAPFVDARPNPFAGSTRLAFRVPAGSGRATLSVFDVRGRRVRSLLDGLVTEGSGTATWDARDDRGRPVPAGIYFYRLETADGTATGKTTLLR